jgi:regulator of vacuolar morphogenesis
MSEHTALQQALRSIRASLLKRDTLAGMGDAAGSRSAGIEVKRNLKDIKSRLNSLENGLEKVDGLGQGERSRREGLLISLKDEIDNVDKMAEAGVRVSSSQLAGSSMGRSGTPVNENDRKSLLGPSQPTGRVFGAAANTPKETAQTRPLDDLGLVQLQQDQMDNQDAQLGQLSSILQRQLKLGQEIGKEIGEQNEMLDELTGEVDRVGGKLGRAKRQMNRLVRLPFGIHHEADILSAIDWDEVWVSIRNYRLYTML